MLADTWGHDPNRTQFRRWITPILATDPFGLDVLDGRAGPGANAPPRPIGPAPSGWLWKLVNQMITRPCVRPLAALIVATCVLTCGSLNARQSDESTQYVDIATCFVTLISDIDVAAQEDGPLVAMDVRDLHQRKRADWNQDFRD